MPLRVKGDVNAGARIAVPCVMEYFFKTPTHAWLEGRDGRSVSRCGVERSSYQTLA